MFEVGQRVRNRRHHSKTVTVDYLYRHGNLFIGSWPDDTQQTLIVREWEADPSSLAARDYVKVIGPDWHGDKSRWGDVGFLATSEERGWFVVFPDNAEVLFDETSLKAKRGEA